MNVRFKKIIKLKYGLKMCECMMYECMYECMCKPSYNYIQKRKLLHLQV
jgi:hypothetical protein